MFNAIEELKKMPLRPYLRKGSKEWWVKMLCQCLLARDYVLHVTDEFDAEVDRLVRMYQKNHGLAADGVVGPKTWSSLAGTVSDGIITDNITGDEQNSAAIVKVANFINSLGIREARGRNNTGAAVEWFLEHAGGNPGDPWCVTFAFAVVKLAYAMVDKYPPKGLPSLSCSAVVRWGRKYDRVDDDGSNAKPGDMYVFRGGDTGFKHIGVVVGSVGEPGKPGFKLITVEGNTNKNGSPDGDGVYLKRRSPERNGTGLGVAVRVS